MRSRRPLHMLRLAVTAAVLSTGCVGPLLVEGVPVSTDPDPNPARVYRTPTWDARTMARAEVITGLARVALMCIPLFPADSWCSSLDTKGLTVQIHPDRRMPVRLSIPTLATPQVSAARPD